MGLSVLIGVAPSKKISENLIKLKKEISKITKEDPFGESEPHITLFVNSFSSLQEIEPELKQLLLKYHPFTIHSEGVHSFGYDPSTNLYTLVYKIKDSSELSQIQKELFFNLSKKRTDVQEKWLLEKNSKPSERQLENLKKYGYFFGPEDWIFHAAISSVPKENFDKLKKLARKLDVKESWEIKEINVYLKRKGDNHHKFHKSYPLISD